MSLQNFKIAKQFTKVAVFILCSFVQVQVKAWEVDFSRRTKDLKSTRGPASVVDQAGSGPQQMTLRQMAQFLKPAEPVQEIVILNTEQGFVPERLTLRAGVTYKVNVVNVDASKKNQSFMLDSFSEHHATFFGDRKSFELSPKIEGIFSFQAPETGRQGQIVVLGGDRAPASQGSR